MHKLMFPIISKLHILLMFCFCLIPQIILRIEGSNFAHKSPQGRRNRIAS